MAFDAGQKYLVPVSEGLDLAIVKQVPIILFKVSEVAKVMGAPEANHPFKEIGFFLSIILVRTPNLGQRVAGAIRALTHSGLWKSILTSGLSSS